MASEFNTAPPGLEVIAQQDFMRYLFRYITKQAEIRSVFEPRRFDLIMIPLDYDQAEGLGIAIRRTFEPIRPNADRESYAYCRYGGTQAWDEFELRFSEQFAGDNS